MKLFPGKHSGVIIGAVGTIFSSEATLEFEMSVCKTRNGRNVIFLAPIQDTRLKLLVNIPIIMKHN